jgi:hypothetical protein
MFLTSTVSSKGGNRYVLLFQSTVGEVIYIVFSSTGSSRGGNRYCLLLQAPIGEVIFFFFFLLLQ